MHWNSGGLLEYHRAAFFSASVSTLSYVQRSHVENHSSCPYHHGRPCSNIERIMFQREPSFAQSIGSVCQLLPMSTAPTTATASPIAHRGVNSAPRADNSA